MINEVRKERFAGMFYPAKKEGLEIEIRKLLKNENKQDISLAIVPHAGYIYSGKIAGEVFSFIKQKKTYIILGVNHSGEGNKVNFSLKDFSTPLGIVKNNNALAERIIEKLKKQGIDAGINEQVHEHEHSIEVQLPFLQMMGENFYFIPIILSNLEYPECLKIAECLSEFLSKDLMILVSSDFTHYGESYGFVPFSENVKNNLYNLDRNVISSIVKMNSREVYEKSGKTTICGRYGITIASEIAGIKKMKAKLISYSSSGDIFGDYTNSVGYAGVVFS
ncbi:AmmeMemoRadiSam system protein B [Candidatus Pacearchaeota archaeon]|nr:AmmeMemoRadiSam system protein B [Candidatus Pacearchaeota archaeon]